MRFTLVIGLVLLLQPFLRAQDAGMGHVSVIRDERIDSVLVNYESLRLKLMENPDTKLIPGYRIQIFFDSGLNSSDRARQTRDEFLLLFPDIPAYVSWKAPNYRVRVGDYKSRLDAEKDLQLIMISYPNAWVTKDEINFPIMK
ncbi:MAG: SPOR domain-containing protein [Bacteroidales bacterium]|nr:SPOR domain-containing protein [Bacteroidales bacterium]